MYYIRTLTIFPTLNLTFAMLEIVRFHMYVRVRTHERSGQPSPTLKGTYAEERCMHCFTSIRSKKRQGRLMLLYHSYVHTHTQ